MSLYLKVLTFCLIQNSMETCPFLVPLMNARDRSVRKLYMLTVSASCVIEANIEL